MANGTDQDGAAGWKIVTQTLAMRQLYSVLTSNLYLFAQPKQFDTYQEIWEERRQGGDIQFELICKHIWVELIALISKNVLTKECIDNEKANIVFWGLRVNIMAFLY